jgi:hypothetical protein
VQPAKQPKDLSTRLQVLHGLVPSLPFPQAVKLTWKGRLEINVLFQKGKDACLERFPFPSADHKSSI